MFSKDLDFLPTIVGDLLEQTQKIEITPIQVEQTIVDTFVEIDVSDLDDKDWWKTIFDENEDGFDSFGDAIYLETELTLEDVLYFSTEEEVKDFVYRLKKQQLRDAFMELYAMHLKILKQAREKLLQKERQEDVKQDTSRKTSRKRKPNAQDRAASKPNTELDGVGKKASSRNRPKRANDNDVGRNSKTSTRKPRKTSKAK